MLDKGIVGYGMSAEFYSDNHIMQAKQYEDFARSAFGLPQL